MRASPRTRSSCSARASASRCIFSDNPEGGCVNAVWIAQNDSCFLPGDFLKYTTSLVGVQQNGQPGPILYSWNWIDDYSTGPPGVSSGGPNRLDSLVPVDPG